MEDRNSKIEATKIINNGEIKKEEPITPVLEETNQETKSADITNKSYKIENGIKKDLYKGRYIPEVKSRPVEKKEYKEFVPEKAKKGSLLIVLIAFGALAFYFFKTPIIQTIAHPTKVSDNFSTFIDTKRGAAKVTSLTKEEIKYLCADEDLVDKSAQKRIKEQNVLYANEVQMLTYYRGAKEYLSTAYPDGGWKITRYMKARNGVTVQYGVYFKSNGAESKVYFDKDGDSMKIYDVNTSSDSSLGTDFTVNMEKYEYGVKYYK